MSRRRAARRRAMRVGLSFSAPARGTGFCNLNISNLAERLDDADFLRLHRSCLANLRFAGQIVRDERKLSPKMPRSRGRAVRWQC